MRTFITGIWICIAMLLVPFVGAQAQTLSPASSEICTGDNLTVTYGFGSGNSGCNRNIVATFNGGAETRASISGNSGTYTFSNTTAGTYVLFAEKVSCSTAGNNDSTNSITIIVKEKPAVAFTGLPATACVGDVVTINATINYNTRTDCNTLKLQVQNGAAWNLVGTAITLGAGVTTHTFTVPTATAATNTYRVTLECSSTGCNSMSSATADIQVLANPVITLTNTLPSQACVGDVQTLNVGINRNGRTTCNTLLLESFDGAVWTQAGTTTLGGAATTHSFTLPNSTAGNFTYRARLTCTAGVCNSYISTTSQNIEFLNGATVSFTGLPASACIGDAVTLDATINYNGRTDCSTLRLEVQNGAAWNLVGTAVTLGAGVTAHTFTVPTATAATNTYRVTLQCTISACSSVSSSTGDIIVLASPVITLTNTLPSQACVGDVQTLSVGINRNGRTNCSTLLLESLVGATWTQAGTATLGGSATTHSFTLPNSTAGNFTYRARLTCTGGICDSYISTTTQNIEFLSVPLVSFTGLPASACVGDAVTIGANITYSGRTDCNTLRLEVQNGASWNLVGAAVTLGVGVTAHTFTIPTASAGSSTYRVTLQCSSSACNSVSSSTGTIIVLGNPVVTLTSTLPSQVCVGATQGLSVGINYNGRTNCGSLRLESFDGAVWNQVGSAVSLSGATSHSFTLPNGTAGSYTYRARLTCTGGVCDSYASTGQTIEFLANPNISISSTLPATVCQSATVTLTATFTLNGRADCNLLQLEEKNGASWDAIGAPLAASGTSQVFTIPTSTVGSYEYRVTMGCSGTVCNSYSTGSQTISVINPPTLTITPATAGPHTLCIGSTLSLGATLSGTPSGCGNSDIVWQESLAASGPWGPIAGASGTSTNVTVQSGARYYSAAITCSSTPGCGLVRTAAVMVTGVLNPTLGLTADKTNSCSGSQVVLTAAVANAGPGCTDYSWTATPQGGSAQALSPTTASITVTPTINTTYRANFNCASSGGCSSPTQTITITVTAQPALTISPSTVNPVCATAPISLTANLAGGIGCSTADINWEASTDNVTWSGTVLTTGATYSFSASTSMYYRAYIECGASSGCTRSESAPVFVEVKLNPTITVAATYPLMVCDAAVVSLQATGAEGAGTCGYQWYGSPSGLPGTYTLIGSCNTGNCTVAVINSNRFVQVRYSCSGSACPFAELSTPIEIIVSGQPDISLSITPSIAKICANSNVTLDAAITGGVACTVNWEISQNGGTSWQPLATASNQVSIDTLTRNTKIKGRTNCTGAGCLQDEKLVDIEVAARPTLNFSLGVPTILCSGSTFGPATLFLSNPTVSGTLELRDSTAATGWISSAPGVITFPAFPVTQERLLAATFTPTSHAGCGVITSDTLTVAPYNLPDTTGVVVSIIPNYCFPKVQGVIELNPSLGYQYSLGSDTTTAQTIYNSLAPDTFTLIIESVSSGCRRTMQVILPDSSNRTQPFALSVGAMDLSGITCFGEDDGWIRPHINGGTSPFTLIYTNQDQAITDTTTNDTITNLSTGTYKIVVQDKYGCELADSNIFIFEPNVLDVFLVDDTVPCTGSPRGMLTAIPFGGTPPYNFNWTNPIASGPSLISLPPGTYTVDLTDANGCLSTGNGIVNAARPLTASIVDSSFGCGTTFRPSIEFEVMGGYSPFRYGITNISGTTISPLTTSSDSTYAITLPQGAPSTFNLIVIDDSLCTITVPVTVSQPLPAVPPTLTSKASQNGNANGTASVTTAYSSYTWSNGGNTQIISGLLPGNYTVTVADNNGCTATGSVEVRLVLVNGIDDFEETATLLPARPNPFSDFTLIPFVLTQSATLKLSLFDVSGKEVAVIGEGEYAPGEYQLTLNNHDLPNGVYYCRLVTGQIVRTQKLIILR